MDALTKPERDTLAQCEGIIARGLRTFIEVGTALMAIRNSRLYRERHGTFEVYLQARWPELSSRRAYQLMEAATVVQNMNPGGETQNPGLVHRGSGAFGRCYHSKAKLKAKLLHHYAIDGRVAPDREPGFVTVPLPRQRLLGCCPQAVQPHSQNV